MLSLSDHINPQGPPDETHPPKTLPRISKDETLAFIKRNAVWVVIIANCFHYIQVLRESEPIAVAIAHGIAVDFFHFASVHDFIEGQFNSLWKRVVSGTFALSLTVGTIAYQQMYFKNLWLACVFPLLVVLASWLRYRDQETESMEIEQITQTHQTTKAKTEPPESKTKMPKPANQNQTPKTKPQPRTKGTLTAEGIHYRKDSTGELHCLFPGCNDHYPNVRGIAQHIRQTHTYNNHQWNQGETK